MSSPGSKPTTDIIFLSVNHHLFNLYPIAYVVHPTHCPTYADIYKPATSESFSTWGRIEKINIDLRILSLTGSKLFKECSERGGINHLDADDFFHLLIVEGR